MDIEWPQTSVVCYNHSAEVLPWVVRSFPMATNSNHRNFDGLKQSKLILFLSWSSRVWNQLHWAETKISAGLHSLLNSQGKCFSLPFPASRALFLGSWPPFASSKHIESSNLSPLLKTSPLLLSLFQLTFLPPSHEDPCDYTGPTAKPGWSLIPRPLT